MYTELKSISTEELIEWLRSAHQMQEEYSVDLSERIAVIENALTARGV
jgi:hypothetical protein